ncbi:TetR family transcriptional regulator [Sphingomonas sp. MMS24-J13]|uniref:TetR family transcriptional regulator n=1 Tax=Sphingomonas sp. MMS24-J13 TaxID=3238686 RepID=UPI0038505AC3
MSFSKLDQDRIVGEALELLGEEGLAQVSLRKLAQRLDVGVSSLYWHVRDKGALYRLMSARVFRSCVDAVPETRTWQEWLREFGLALWHAQVTVRDAHQLIAQASLEDGLRHKVREEIVATLAGLGLAAEIAAAAQRSVQALVTGWTTLKPLQDEGEDRPMFEDALDALIAGWEARAGA